MLGRDMKKLRTSMGVTREALSVAMKVKPYTITTWELLRHDRPIKEAEKILKYMCDLQVKRTKL